MNVLFYAYYLADRNIEKRQIDWAPIKIKQWIKGEQIRGSFSIRDTRGVEQTFGPNDRRRFMDTFWRSMANQILSRVDGTFSLVPIPGHSVVQGTRASYRTLEYAQAIASHSGGRLKAVDALRWIEEREPQRGTSGWRQPDARYRNLAVTAIPASDVIIVDDVFTSGSSLTAARWRLQENRTRVVMAACAVKPCHEQRERMSGWHEEELPAFVKPMF